jgi:hypothetical protein
MSISREKLSGSTDGNPIKVTQTAIATGDTVHTAVASTTSWDEVWLWVTNTHSADVTLTVGWDGSTDPDNLIMKTVTIPALTGPVLVIPGIIINNSGVVTAAAGTANELVLTGYVNRIVP